MHVVETMGTAERRQSAGERVSGPVRSSLLRRYLALGLMIFLGAAAIGSARFLVVNEPRQADVILVLAGETNVRLEKALQLASHGFGGRIIVNVPDWTRFYDHPELELAREWAQRQAFPVTICPTHGLSTKDEARDTARCLDQEHARRVLIVTSDFHTRRALSTLSKELPDHEFSIAAAYDPAQFGTKWWEHRQWTKTNFYEWTRLVWWELIDRWI